MYKKQNIEIIKIMLMIFRILILLMLIWCIIPYLIERVLEIFQFKHIIKPPKGNSVLVMSYHIFKKNFIYYLRRIILLYFKI